MNDDITNQLDDCIKSLVSEIDAKNPCYETFYKNCVRALHEKGFGIDTELLTTALRLRSEEHFEITGTTTTRERELYCFRKIRNTFRKYTCPQSA